MIYHPYAHITYIDTGAKKAERLEKRKEKKEVKK